MGSVQMDWGPGEAIQDGFQEKGAFKPRATQTTVLLSSLREASGQPNGLSFMPCSNIPSMATLSPALLYSSLSIYV